MSGDLDGSGLVAVDDSNGDITIMKISLQDELPVISGLLAGTDEAGRGPLAGNVVAAAVILNPDNLIAGLDDSKKLSEKKRQILAEEIKQKALCWSVISTSYSTCCSFSKAISLTDGLVVYDLKHRSYVAARCMFYKYYYNHNHFL